MTTIHILCAMTGCYITSYDMLPYETIYHLRRMIAEDQRLRNDNAVCLYRDSIVLDNQEPLLTNETLHAAIHLQRSVASV